MVHFSEIKRFAYQPTGIASTQDNNILVCVRAEDDKTKKQVDYLHIFIVKEHYVDHGPNSDKLLTLTYRLFWLSS